MIEAALYNPALGQELELRALACFWIEEPVTSWVLIQVLPKSIILAHTAFLVKNPLSAPAPVPTATYFWSELTGHAMALRRNSVLWSSILVRGTSGSKRGPMPGRESYHWIQCCWGTSEVLWQEGQRWEGCTMKGRGGWSWTLRMIWPSRLNFLLLIIDNPFHANNLVLHTPSLPGKMWRGLSNDLPVWWAFLTRKAFFPESISQKISIPDGESLLSEGQTLMEGNHKSTGPK